MPRCYMVKKGTTRLEGPPPCSPTEASVAPPCYHPTDNEPRPAQYAECSQTAVRYEEPRSGDSAEGRGCSLEIRSVYSEARASPDTEPQRDYSSRHKCKLEYVDTQEYDCDRRYTVPRAVHYVETETVEVEFESNEYDEPRLADYPEPHHADYEPCTEYKPALVERGVDPEPAGEYAELRSLRTTIVREHSAADTEAAHDLLSLAASVPPLPPAAVLTVLRAPEPVLPVYTYTLQPASIYIIADDHQPEANLYHAVQTLTPVHQVEYTSVEPGVNTYIAYQETVGGQSVEYQPVYRDPTPSPGPLVVDECVGVPVSVIEVNPQLESVPLSVQVPVIEPVPRNPPAIATEQAMDSDPDDPAPVCLNEKQGKYECADCGKCYATSSNLSRHKQTHRSLDSQAAKRCGECGKAYVSMPALAMHVLTHRMGHVCGVCGKQFSRPWLLRGHLRSHTGEKPYNCESCGKAFADRSNLRAHLQTHSGDKKWECLRCNKTFALKSYLNKHQEAACTQDD